MTAGVRVIGVGQMHRGDDSVGLVVVDYLRALTPPGVELRYGAADGAALLAQIEGLPSAILVDCARGRGQPGQILKVDPAMAPGGAAATGGSHGNALADALALGGALGCLPSRLTILTVVGERFAVGEPMSDAVRAAIPSLAMRVLECAADMNRG
jgi:hydrogenase maturation protease